MHFEIRVEDLSGRELLALLVPRILGDEGKPHTWRIFHYKGIGRLPRDLHRHGDPAKRILLDQLPRILAGYARSLPTDSAVIVVCDLDNRDCVGFKQELLGTLPPLLPHLAVLFRIAIEEMEAWLLGDPEAVLRAYPKAKVKVLDSYKQDSICGTWELLADATLPGGANQLRTKGHAEVGRQKSEWAKQIGKFMHCAANRSPSFRAFRTGLERLASSGTA